MLWLTKLLALSIKIIYHQCMIKNASPILKTLRKATVNEGEAVVFLERQRWGDDPACPRCGDIDVYQMYDKDGQRNKDYRWRCRGCRQMFTVRTGTIFEESRLPLRVWVYAFWKACSSKKGISALQLAREMEITHKSALFVLRRIRHGLGHDDASKLTGTVEVDETYVGASLDTRGSQRRARHEEDARVGHGRAERQRPVSDDGPTDCESIGEVLAENADLSCRVITDELAVYPKATAPFTGGHDFVKHSRGEYVRLGTDIHSNTIEGCSHC